LAGTKTPPLSKPPLTLADALGLTYIITEGVAEKLPSYLEFANGVVTSDVRVHVVPFWPFLSKL